jgi:polysaccharide biosynthesis protein PslG
MSQRPAASALTVRAALVVCLSLLVALVPAGAGSASSTDRDGAKASASGAGPRATFQARIRHVDRRARCKMRKDGRASRARSSRARRALKRKLRRAARARARRCATGRLTPRRDQRPGATASGRCASAASCATPPPSGDRLTPVTPRGDLRIGLVANTQGFERHAGREQDAAEQTGAGWLREELDWDVIEPRNGQWDWERYDIVFGEAARRGLRILPLLNSSASWAAPDENQFPTDLGDYADYVAKVAERYGPGGAFWQANPELAGFAATHFELWNEPYIEYFSNDKVSPQRYARLAKAGASAGKAANPQAKFLLAADTFYTEAPGDYRNWIDGMYDAVPDLNDWFDAVAIHPYSHSISPDVYTPGRGDHGSRWQFRRVEEMRERFDAHGAQDKGFWITELGWATCDGDDDCVSEAQQAEYMSRVFEYARGPYRDFMEAVFVYHLRDWGPADHSNREYWFGLTRKDGSRKPAFEVLRRAAGLR